MVPMIGDITSKAVNNKDAKIRQAEVQRISIYGHRCSF